MSRRQTENKAMKIQAPCEILMGMMYNRSRCEGRMR